MQEIQGLIELADLFRVNHPVEQASLEANVCLWAFDFAMFTDPPNPPVPKLGGSLKFVRVVATVVERRLNQRIAVVLPNEPENRR